MTSTQSDGSLTATATAAEAIAPRSMSKILVPYDGTELSDKAFDTAIEVARSFGSEMIILHVVDAFIPPSVTLSFISDKTPLEEARTEIIERLRQGAEAMLVDRLEKAKSRGVNVRFAVAVGSPAEEISNFARNENVGLIIMGSKKSGKGIIGILGGVARKVSETAPCSVMLVQ